MRIKQFAQLTNLSAKTIRYYEDIELIAPATRGENGYRQYDSKAVEELHFLARAREVGFDLQECRQLLELQHDQARQSRHASRRSHTGVRAVITANGNIQDRKVRLMELRHMGRGDIPICDYDPVEIEGHVGWGP